MKSDEALQKLLNAFKRYYDITQENVLPPFDAQAVFHSHDEKFLLLKEIKLFEMDSNEHVYFSAGDILTPEKITELSDLAWKDGLSKVKPFYGHRNSDITVILLYQTISPEAKKAIRKQRHSKSYKLTFFGWSNFCLAAADLSRMKFYSNWFGRDTKSNIKLALTSLIKNV